jgi:hypothetical protein
MRVKNCELPREIRLIHCGLCLCVSVMWWTRWDGMGWDGIEVERGVQCSITIFFHLLNE